jgi:hypothetical protein
LHPIRGVDKPNAFGVSAHRHAAGFIDICIAWRLERPKLTARFSERIVMTDRWTGWKSFPDHFYGEYIQAPIGPGVYEVCRTATREQVAFGCTQNVAESLCDILKPGKGRRRFFFFGARKRYGTGELEYRIWPTPTLSEAKVALKSIRGQRDAVWRRHAAAAR